MRRVIIGLSGASILAFGFLLLLLPRVVSDGAASVPIEFRIIDVYNRPIAGAKICALRDIHMVEPTDAQLAELCLPAVTDQSGKARLCLVCGASWSPSFLGKRGTFVVRQHLLIKADGHRTLFSPLSNLVGGYRLPLEKRPIKLEVRMIPTITRSQ